MGGAGLPVGIMFVVAIVLVALLSIFVIIPWTRAQNAKRAEVLGGSGEKLVYEVPEGQDPARVRAAHTAVGLAAAEPPAGGRRAVVIACPSDKDEVRPRARAVIEHQADLNLEGDPSRQEVRFADE